MKTRLIQTCRTVIGLLILLGQSVASGGAVSAGGMQAAAKMECLFADPESDMRVMNFAIFNYGLPESAPQNGSLSHVDLSVGDILSCSSYSDILSEESSGAQTYRAKGDGHAALQINVDGTSAVQFAEIAHHFRAPTNNGSLWFTPQPAFYRANLFLMGKSYAGFCSADYFAFYVINGHGH